MGFLLMADPGGGKHGLGDGDAAGYVPPRNRLRLSGGGAVPAAGCPTTLLARLPTGWGPEMGGAARAGSAAKLHAGCGGNRVSRRLCRSWVKAGGEKHDNVTLSYRTKEEQ
jgi:hypothetical protein